MAKISIGNIYQINLTSIPTERTCESKMDLALHPLVAKKYKGAGYDNKPKNKQERDERGLTGGWNGLNSSFPRIATYSSPNGIIVSADIAPTRYLVGQAMRDLMKEGNYTSKKIQKMSPDMAGCSLISPIKLNGKYFLLAQIKGDALGSGQVHAGLVAGNVDIKYLKKKDILGANLGGECSDEVGMDLSNLEPTSAVFMVDERETGQVNFAYVAQKTDIDNVLTSYESEIRNKFQEGKKLEVAGLALIPLEGDLSKLVDGKLSDIQCFVPSETGLDRIISTREVRPYTAAFMDYVSNSNNLKFLLDKGGF
jgi:hypothetical protein